MFKHLQEIDVKLYQRYLTLEKNIKAGSNSFYDSYLDLQEQFIKGVAVSCGFDIRAKESCGELLKREDITNFFKVQLNIEPYIYEKMQDYTLKVNAHKHKGEKNIQVDTIVSYMRIIYDATSTFARFKGVRVNGFNADYFINLFGVFEKENFILKQETLKLKEELLASVENGKLRESDIITYKSLLSQAEIDKMDLEEQNQVLYRQISALKDIKLSSMEEKLNKTLELLYELTESVAENRVMSHVAGSLICGEQDFLARVEKAKLVKKDE